MSPIYLDLHTLALVLVLVTLFLSFVMVFVWWTQKTYDGFGLWVNSNIVIAIGVILLGIDGTITDMVGTTLTFSAVLIGYEGNRRFLRLEKNPFFSLIFLSSQLFSYSYFRFFEENIVLQVSVSSFLVAVISGYCGYIFIRHSSEKANFSYRFTGITYLIFSSLLIVRAMFTGIYGSKQDFYAADGIQPIFFMLYILFEIIWSFNYINLNSERLQQELTKTQIELETLATTDFLTGINNNRRFFEISKNEIQRSKRFRHSLSLIMFDIDYFKKINDQYGHAAGDKVLVELTNICRNSLRGIDILARIGGEEFAVLMTNTDIEGAHTVAEYLCETIKNAEIEILSRKVKITASFGVAELLSSEDNIELVMERADNALYEAKRKGRNQVISKSLGNFANLRIVKSN